MSTSETLKRQRTASKGRFTRTLNDLKRALGDEYYDIDVINSTFDDVNESWKNVNSKHEDYMSSIKDGDDDNTEGDGWIGSMQQQFYEIRKQVNKMKHEDEIKVTVEKAKRIRDFGYSNLRVMYSNIDLLIEKKCLSKGNVRLPFNNSRMLKRVIFSYPYY